MAFTLSISDFEAQLNDLRLPLRSHALTKLMERKPDAPAPTEVANMHCHTFFSYNAYGHSPTSLAWLGRQQGYALMGIVDFDVLDGVDEFLDACEITGVRGSAGIESRVYVPEFAQDEMNSPGEPGVLYHMGIGFASSQVTGEAAAILESLRTQAHTRNVNLVQRVNDYLFPVAIDYDADVLPLTPNGNATERHIVAAYLLAAARRFYTSEREQVRFWAGRLQMDETATEQAMTDMAGFQNLVRSKLMKKGGVGYVQPGEETFPPVEKLHALVLACGALPCAAWLDGTSSGEQRMDELLDLLIGKGVVALNIVPDRNWNIKDPSLRDLKVRKLHEVVALARRLDLPLNIGTEMNSFGQKLVDDFDAPELAPVKRDFIDGAYFIYGHTAMQRHVGLGYQSAWAQHHMSTRSQRNEFYAAVGRLVPPARPGSGPLTGVSDAMSPADVLAYIT